MKKKVLKFIEDNKMFKYRDSVVLGVSGGADSMCLLWLLKDLTSLELDLHVVHVNHHIRKEEAKEDAEFVRNVCHKSNIDFVQFDFDIPEIVRQENLSEEEAGRIKRYEAFRQYADQINADKIAVAHNLNDNSETVLFNLFRGTGIKGLKGIEPLKDMIARPLLCCTREEIERYNKENNIEYVTDSTNNETEYSRNKIRLELLPLIEKNINEGATYNIVNAAENLRDIADYMDFQIKKAYTEYVQNDELICEGFGLPRAIVSGIIRNMIEKQSGKLKDITKRHIDQVLDLRKKEVSKIINLPYQLVARRTYTGIAIEKEIDRVISENKEEKLLSENQIYETEFIKACFEKNGYNEKMEEDIMCTKWLDYDKIQSLNVRFRKPGDYLVVNNDGGKKKLKDYFIDQKIPKELRDEILLVADGNHIVWIVGYRISSYYKITEQTKKIIRLDYVKK